MQAYCDRLRCGFRYAGVSIFGAVFMVASRQRPALSRSYVEVDVRWLLDGRFAVQHGRLPPGVAMFHLPPASTCQLRTAGGPRWSPGRRLVRHGGFTTGGMNFDAKVRRRSVGPEDCSTAMSAASVARSGSAVPQRERERDGDRDGDGDGGGGGGGGRGRGDGDRAEGIPGTGIYYGLGWIALLLAVALLIVGLFNATLQLSEEGFYAMSFVLALFGAVTVQKNTRDTQHPKPRFVDADSAPSIAERRTAGGGRLRPLPFAGKGGERAAGFGVATGRKPERSSPNLSERRMSLPQTPRRAGNKKGLTRRNDVSP
jgi:hypothetical protein